MSYDWRSTDAADMLMQLGRDQFAIEFLRRNREYVQDYRNTQDSIATGVLAHDAGMAGLAQRWGLSFPACARKPCMGVGWVMASGTLAVLCHCGRRTCDLYRCAANPRR